MKLQTTFTLLTAAVIAVCSSELVCPTDLGVPGICEEKCSGDSSCNTGEKCCSLGCSHYCVRAVESVVPYYCQGVQCPADQECKWTQTIPECQCPDIPGIECDCPLLPTTKQGACVPKEPRCENWAVCAIHCVHGNSVNKDGCPLCSCSPPPGVCDTHNCPAGQKCIPQQVQCFTTPCYPVPQCVADSANVCSLPQEPGPCEAYMPSWSYDAVLGSCTQFIYGGCQGNENRFSTREQCEAKCQTKVCGPVCAMYCTYGMKSSADGCPICECNAPPPGCENKKCDRDGEVCKIVEVTMCPSCLVGTPPDQCRCITTYESSCVNEFPKNCGQLDCALTCTSGHVVDFAGCPVCRCVDPEPQYCKDVTCDNDKVCKWADTGLRCSQCAPGFECPPCPIEYGAVCVAKNPVNCAPGICANYCPHGHAAMLDGCIACDECNPPPVCAPCHLGCQTSSTKGPDGCPLCQCIDPPNLCEGIDCAPGEICRLQHDNPPCHCPPGLQCDCPETQPPHPMCVPIHECPPTCRLGCEHGHKIGADGCRLCECNPPPMDCEYKKCSRDQICKMVESRACSGCTRGPCICTTIIEAECVPRHPRSCKALTCDVSCQFGQAVDMGGCLTCRCAPPPRPPCPPRTCDLNCPYGFVKSLEGCELCVCKHPCQDFFCENGKECKIVSHRGECDPNDQNCLSEVEPKCVEKDRGCPRIRCQSTCQNGLVSGPDGCEVCICSPFGNNSYPCPMIGCTNECSFGRSIRSNGCRGCGCLPNSFPVDVCGQRAGPLMGKNNNALTCSECPSGSECVKYNNFITGFEVCCSTSSNAPEENGLKLDVIRLILTFPNDFDYIRYSMDSFKSAVIEKVVSSGIERKKIKVIHLREGSIVVDMEIDVDGDQDKQAVQSLKEKAERGQFTVRHNNQNFKASRAQTQYSYSADDDSDGDNKKNHILIIALCAIAGVVIIVVVLAVVFYMIKKNARVQDSGRGRNYERSENTYDNDARMTPPPSYSPATYPEKTEKIQIA